MANYESDLHLTVSTLSNALKASIKETMRTQKTLSSPLYFIILKGIYENEHCTAQDLTEITFKDKGQIARLVKELIFNEIIAKEVNPSDKRSQFLCLTETGFQYYLQLKAVDDVAINIMRSGISDKELDTFIKLGKKMSHNLSSINTK